MSPQPLRSPTIRRDQSRGEADVDSASLKVLAFDSGQPLVSDESAATYERASEKHGRLGVGDKIRLITGHCDPTVNLYDWYVCVRGYRVEQVPAAPRPGAAPPIPPLAGGRNGERAEGSYPRAAAGLQPTGF